MVTLIVLQDYRKEYFNGTIESSTCLFVEYITATENCSRGLIPKCIFHVNAREVDYHISNRDFCPQMKSLRSPYNISLLSGVTEENYSYT